MPPSSSKITFEGQQPNEVVYALIRRHPSIMLPIANLVVGLLLLPWVVFALSDGFSTAFSTTFLVTFAAALVLAATTYYRWSRDRYLITNQRVIAADQPHTLEQLISEAPYEKVVEISYTVIGWRQNAWHLGTVIVKTAGHNDLRLRDVPHPEEVERMLTELVTQAE